MSVGLVAKHIVPLARPKPNAFAHPFCVIDRHGVETACCNIAIASVSCIDVKERKELRKRIAAIMKVIPEQAEYTIFDIGTFLRSIGYTSLGNDDVLRYIDRKTWEQKKNKSKKSVSASNQASSSSRDLWARPAPVPVHVAAPPQAVPVQAVESVEAVDHDLI